MATNNISNNRGSFLYKRLLTIVAVITFILCLSVWLFQANIKRNKINAFALTTGCKSYTDNRRIVCYANYLSNEGTFRYASANTAGITTYWKDYWKNQNANSFLGHREDYWWKTERFDANKNFLDCSGFVNVVFYLANNQSSLLGGASSFQYQNNPKFQKITNAPNFTDYSWLLKLKPGDLLIKDEYLAPDGKRHVAIFNSVTYNASNNTYTLNSIEASATKGFKHVPEPSAGIRIRNYTQGSQADTFPIHYALRWTAPFN